MKHLALPSSHRTFGALALLCLASASLHAALPEWPRFRGANGSGVGKANLPDAITAQSFNWKVELPGTGHSSPVIAGDRIFLNCNPVGTGNDVLVCVNAKDGKIVWKHEYVASEFRKHSDNSFASSSPAVDGERVYVSWMSPEGSGIAALDQRDGKELWKRDLGPFVSQHGPGVSPIVVDDLVLLDFDPDQPKSFLAAFDAKTGAEKWRWEHPGGMHSSSTPCIITPKSGGTQVVSMSKTIGVTGLDVKTGKIAWQIPGLLTKRCVASPIVTDDGLVILQCGEGQAESFVYAVKVADDGKSAQKVYEVLRTGGYVPTPLALGPYLFLWKENGLVTCLRAANNEQVWSERVQGPFYGSPIAVGNRLYNVTRKGELVTLSATDKFQELGRSDLGEGSFASPAVSGGRMYLRTFTHLISVGNSATPAP